MNIKKYVLYTLFAGLACSVFSGPLLAMEGDVAEDITEISEEVSNSWIYEKTLGENPGICLALVAGAFATHIVHQKYKSWNNARAKTRRTVLNKIQKAHNDYSNYGNHDYQNVQNIHQVNVAQSIAELKENVLSDARTIHNWGMLQDTRLIALIEEFFQVLTKKASGQNAPVAVVPVQSSWYMSLLSFFKTAQPAQRLLADILSDIEDCLCGSCG